MVCFIGKASFRALGVSTESVSEKIFAKLKVILHKEKRLVSTYRKKLQEEMLIKSILTTAETRRKRWDLMLKEI